MDLQILSRPSSCLASLLTLVLPLAAQHGKADGYKPVVPIKKASDEAQKAIARFQLPTGMTVKLFAAEPSLANPVSFTVGPRGRVYVCETFRLHKGVTDNRSHGGTWLDEELACRTVADRVAMYERKFPGKIDEWKREHERVRLLEDRDGDGRADFDRVFAGGFNQLADGIAAGVLVRGNSVYYTCIPNLWKLDDDDRDGVAERRKALHSGYGVHTSLLGHDLHGLILGPDGKIYFSIGDRGFHIEQEPGSALSMPDEGAVFRCNPDGSELEVVHRGLRNPQELAFDDHGNLFTGDNNSDGGDKARWVYVVEGGNSGWHIGFQSIPDRGPWNREKMWHPQHPGQPAYILPPIANVTNGPSGLLFDPGTGLPSEFRGSFLLCDFRGASANSGITALRNRPKGAGFELASAKPFIWKILATDVEVGPDGAIWISDWTEGWGQTGKGRLYRMIAAENSIGADARRVRDVARLLREGMKGRSTQSVATLLRHVDRRIRLEAQLELVARNETEALRSALAPGNARLGRLHAIWGLGILAKSDPRVLDHLGPHLEDFDEEVRAQIAKVFGWAAATARSETMQRWLPKLRKGLEDRSARVQFFTAISVGKLGDHAARSKLYRVLERNADLDPYLRHAAVLGLARLARGKGEAGIADLVGQRKHRSVSRRMGALLALRLLEHPEIAKFLGDADPAIVAEAARAIHDVPIQGAMPALATLLVADWPADDPTLRRAIAANYRLGKRQNFERLVAFAGSSKAPRARRVDVLNQLATFEKPAARDTVVNLWRPVTMPRNITYFDVRMAALLKDVLSRAPGDVQVAAARVARKLRSFNTASVLSRLVQTAGAPANARRESLETLIAFGKDGRGARGQPVNLTALAELCGKSKDGALRAAGLRALAKLDPNRAAPLCVEQVRTGRTTLEKQNAIRLLGGLKGAAAVQQIGTLLAELAQNRLPKALALETLEAAGKRKELKAKLAAYEAARAGKGALAQFSECLDGGDPRKGQRVFRRHAAAQCTRCHTVDGKGGNAGPDLKGIGKLRTPTELLESLVDPGAKIVEGFGTFVFEMKDGNVHSGTAKTLPNGKIEVKPEEGKAVVIDPKQIDFKSEPTSAMPGVKGVLNKKQIRDLMAWLRTRK